jgi:4-cresol dehydrogenase (hydroxylating)
MLAPLVPSLVDPSPARQGCRALSLALGAEHVRVDEACLASFGRSTGPADIRPLAVVRPKDTAEVQEVVRIAARFGLALHAISRGRNWGYGDACAAGPGQVVVDLGRMDRIVEVDRELGYCVIEPGVTQGQLAAYLREQGTGLWMDATGAGPDASLVGNTLDRGFGHTPYGDHVANTCGMDVVLADGRLLRTGYGHYEGAKAARAYRYGVGPSLDGLFQQSGLGIVTRIGLWLMPEPEAFAGYFIRVPKDEDLEEVIDLCAASGSTRSCGARSTSATTCASSRAGSATRGSGRAARRRSRRPSGPSSGPNTAWGPGTCAGRSTGPRPA